MSVPQECFAFYNVGLIQGQQNTYNNFVIATVLIVFVMIAFSVFIIMPYMKRGKT